MVSLLLHLSVCVGKNKRKLGHSYKIGQYFPLIPHSVIGSFGKQYETSHTVHLFDESLSPLYWRQSHFDYKSDCSKGISYSIYSISSQYRVCSAMLRTVLMRLGKKQSSSTWAHASMKPCQYRTATTSNTLCIYRKPGLYFNAKINT